MTPYWLTAFIDLTAEHYARGVEYWCDITGYRVSAARGELGEFASLVPDDGDDHLRVQRLADGTDRIHLDLHVEDPPPRTPSGWAPPRWPSTRASATS